LRAARAIREAKGITLREVEAALGISQGILSRFESGAGMREAKELAYARYLGVSLEQLLADAPTAEVPA
jgi:transcriptional regulator with XRE-family HTH domain